MSKFTFEFEGQVTFIVPGEMQLNNPEEAGERLTKVILEAVMNHYSNSSTPVKRVQSDASITNVMQIIGSFADE